MAGTLTLPDAGCWLKAEEVSPPPTPTPAPKPTRTPTPAPTPLPLAALVESPGAAVPPDMWLFGAALDTLVCPVAPELKPAQTTQPRRSSKISSNISRS